MILMVILMVILMGYPLGIRCRPLKNHNFAKGKSSINGYEWAILHGYCLTLLEGNFMQCSSDDSATKISHSIDTFQGSCHFHIRSTGFCRVGTCFLALRGGTNSTAPAFSTPRGSVTITLVWCYKPLENSQHLVLNMMYYQDYDKYDHAP